MHRTGRQILGTVCVDDWICSYEIEKVRPFEQLHRHERLVSVGEQLVELNEVRVCQIGERAEFPLQPMQRIRIMQNFQGESGVLLAIEYFIDDAEAAMPHLALDNK